MNYPLIERAERMREVLTTHGIDLAQALLIIVVGLIAIQWTMKKLKIYLERVMSNRAKAATIMYIIYILLLVVVVTSALVELGFDTRIVLRMLVIISLAAIAIIILFRPYIPTLPFKVGNTVKVGSLLGKIEATTMIHTRMRTFDGKTVFIPNSKILNDFVINYHFTPTRRIKIDIPIRHFKDMLPVKQILESVMVEDPRVLLKPARPVVYVLNVEEGCIKMGARCWVKNPKFWVARCDLLEKMLLRLSHEGVRLAYRRKVVQIVNEETGETSVELDSQAV